MRGIGAHYPELPSSILTLWANPVSSASTLSLSTSHGVFRGSLHNSQSQESSSLYCLRHMKVTYFNNGEKRERQRVFAGNLRTPLTYYSSKNKKIRDGVDSRVQLVWRLRVMGSWRDHWNIKEPYEGINRFYLDTIKIIRPSILSPSVDPPAKNNWWRVPCVKSQQTTAKESMWSVSNKTHSLCKIDLCRWRQGPRGYLAWIEARDRNDRDGVVFFDNLGHSFTLLLQVA